MGKVILTDAFIEIDGVDLSNHANQVTMELPDDEVEVSGFGSAYKEYGKGLSDATITVTFIQDFATGEVDDTLWPLKSTTTPFDVVIRPTSAAVGAENPEYTMQSLMYNYAPVSGGLGEASTTEVSFRNASQAGIVRATS